MRFIDNFINTKPNTIGCLSSEVTFMSNRETIDNNLQVKVANCGKFIGNKSSLSSCHGYTYPVILYARLTVCNVSLCMTMGQPVTGVIRTEPDHNISFARHGDCVFYCWIVLVESRGSGSPTSRVTVTGDLNNRWN